MNTTTRRHPRTLSEAFGPYNRGGLYTEPEPMHAADKIIVGALCAALVAVFFLAVL